MASTYSPNLGYSPCPLTVQKFSGLVGSVSTNTNLGTLLEQAVSGYVTQAVCSLPLTLRCTMSNGATDSTCP